MLRVLTSTGQRSFSLHVGPTVWNSLPSALRDVSLSVTEHVRAAAEDCLNSNCTPSGAVVAFWRRL